MQTPPFPVGPLGQVLATGCPELGPSGQAFTFPPHSIMLSGLSLGGRPSAQTYLRELRAICHLPPHSRAACPSLKGDACRGLTQHHPEKNTSPASPSGCEQVHPLVSTLGEGAWLQARLAQAPGLCQRHPQDSRRVPCEHWESPGRLCQPLVPMEQLAPGLSRRSNPSTSSRSSPVLGKPHEGQGLGQTVLSVALVPT